MKRILTKSAWARTQRVEELERRLERVESELHALRNRAKQLEHHNSQLTEAATERETRIQELERELQEIASRPHDSSNFESRLQDAQRLNDSYSAVVTQLEAQLANAQARLQDEQRLSESYTAIIKELEAHLANGQAQCGIVIAVGTLITERRRHSAVVTQLEAQLANTQARLQDEQRLSESYSAIIRQLEASIANAQAQDEDVRRLSEITDAQLASADNTTLERLFEAYGLIDLAREVKARRLKVQNWRKAAKAD